MMSPTGWKSAGQSISDLIIDVPGLSLSKNALMLQQASAVGTRLKFDLQRVKRTSSPSQKSRFEKMMRVSQTRLLIKCDLDATVFQNRLLTWAICTRRAGKLHKDRSRLYRSQILQVNSF